MVQVRQVSFDDLSDAYGGEAESLIPLNVPNSFPYFPGTNRVRKYYCDSCSFKAFIISFANGFMKSGF